MVEEREGKRENVALGHIEIWSHSDSLEVGECQFAEVLVPNLSQIFTFQCAV
jgi:hypothetical protein